MKEVLKFSASWCGPCKMLTKTIEGISDLPIPIKEIDIDENLDMSAKYGIRGVPTLVMLENGVEVKRKTGALNTKQLMEFLHG